MARKIASAAVIGAGVMGGGIAALLASRGIRTLLLDIVPPDLESENNDDLRQRNRIAQAGLDAVSRSKPPLFMDPSDADLVSVGNLDDDFEKLGDCDWIVEAVVENLAIKRGLFRRIEGVRKKGAVVSTNTSGLPLKSISEGFGTDFKRHFLGTHFFNPVRYMRLLEIIPGEETSPEVLDFVADFGERILGKGVVWAKDTPNFVGNRIGVQQIVSAMREMGGFGLNVVEVDALFGPVLGRPKTALFKTCDLVGIDTLAHVAKNTYDLVAEDEQRESFKAPAFLGVMVERKVLGNKAGGGFYRSELVDGKKVPKFLDLKKFEYREASKPDFKCLVAASKAKSLEERLRAVLYGEDRGARFAWRVTAGSLIYAARRIPEIADSIVEIDNSMKWGYNLELGPFELWDALGVAQSVEKMRTDGFDVPQKIERMIDRGHASFYKLENGKRFYYDFVSEDYAELEFGDSVLSLGSLKASGKEVEGGESASLVDLGDGVFCFEFHTKMNALNREIVEFMDKALDYVRDNGAGLVIGNQAGGMPGAFSAGGDLYYMGTLVKEGKFEEIEKLLELAQGVMQKSKYGPFPVVAAPYGLTLGGGCEICIGAADRIVAHAELYMGLVEIGVGLLPAGGGCMNLWKKTTQNVLRSVQGLDLAKFFASVFRNVAMAKVSSSAAHARKMGFLGPEDRIVFNRDRLVGEAKKEVLRMIDDGYFAPVKRPLQVFGDAAQGVVNMELNNMLVGGFASEYDVFLAKRIGYVIGGGDVRVDARIDEDIVLKLEREAFVDFWKEPKTHDRVEHMLKTGKPLRN